MKKIVRRRQLLEVLLTGRTTQKKLVFIEARAGAGKSVLAQQYFEQCETAQGWFQVSAEDQDPMTLFSAVCALLLRTLPEFQSPGVVSSLATGVIAPNEVVEFAKLLTEELADLKNQSPLVLVLDDLHLLQPSKESCSLLSTLIRHSPSWIQWLLVSRVPVDTLVKTRTGDTAVLRIEDHHLRLKVEDIALLLRSMYGLGLTIAQLNEIHRITEGWAMGVALVGEQGADRFIQFNSELSRRERGKHLSSLCNYFLINIFRGYSPERVAEIMQLVLLDELELPLVKTLLGEEKGRCLLEELRDNNPFIRCLQAERGIYSFHHLFYSSIRPYAESQLPEEIRQRVVREAVEYYSEQNEIETALKYAARSEDRSLLEETIARFGAELFNSNRIVTIHTYLSVFPKEEILCKPLLSLFFGICLQAMNPVEAQAFLESACKGFLNENNALGEIQARCQLVEFFILIKGMLAEGAEHVVKIEELYNELSAVLPLPVKARTLYILAEGYCYIIANIEKAHNYIDLATRLCLNNQLHNVMGGLAVISNYRYGFVGNWQGFAQNIEETYHLLAKPEVSNLAKLFLKLSHINLLEMIGDFKNYTHQRNRLEEGELQELIRQTILHPFLYIFDADHAIAEGRLEDGLETIEKGVHGGIAFEKPHTRSQYLHYKAYILALKKDKQGALRCYEESLKLRQQAGGNAFIVLNHQILGITCLHLDLYDKARQHFQAAEELMRGLGSEFRWANTDAHLAYYWLKKKETAKALLPIENCLKYLRKKNHRYFFTWTPEVMTTVLSAALEHGVEQGYARVLVKEQLKAGISGSNELIPRLHTHILVQPTGDETEKKYFQLNTLPRHQRQLLMGLFFSPGMQMSFYEAAFLLWPEKKDDKDSDRLRSSMDTLISKLRKQIKKTVLPVAPQEYLVVKKGTIGLRNWQIDGVDFLQHLHDGKKLASMGRQWQASNAFHRAFALWSGDGKIDSALFDHGEEHLDELKHHFLTGAKVWSHILIASNDIHAARSLSNKAFRLVPEDTAIARQCYDLYAQTKDSFGCKKVLRQHREAQQKMNESEAETALAMERFWGQDD
ncbi:AAA family ATPase [Desulfogranum mediterraneum]|uniref:AAA family ATPase n=1 Tax=Desulfogranum mediterraneum TaxID=160661 RepID=UPI001ABEFF10|nr:AAA family ATPase [Desulfogranum mediterraneum]